MPDIVEPPGTPGTPETPETPEPGRDSPAYLAALSTLSPRQRRLRVITAIVFIVLGVMIFVGFSHPFFHPVVPPFASLAVRRAFAVRALFIMLYWSICFVLLFSLVIVAWLDYREIKLKMLMARRDIFRDIADRASKSHKEEEKRGQVSGAPRKANPKPSKRGSRVNGADDKNGTNGTNGTNGAGPPNG
jgi:hypothetical protein